MAEPPSAFAVPAAAQQPQRPTFQTTKVEGTDNVYIFRYQNHQAMFVVTPEGVIATDPISYARPQAAQAGLRGGDRDAHERDAHRRNRCEPFRDEQKRGAPDDAGKDEEGRIENVVVLRPRHGLTMTRIGTRHK